MNRAFLLILFLFAISVSLHAEVETNDSVDYDRIMREMLEEDYIKASLLVASSGDAIYSAPGHAALRLECPSHEIDYCYEFDNFVNLDHLLDYINGDMEALFKRIYTQDFIARYAEEGRGVQAVTLDLRPRQEVELWQSLDYQVDSVGRRSFDFLNNNCASMVVRVINESLYPEHIEYRNLSPYLTGTHRQVFPYIFARAPWAEFFWNILMGTGFDDEYDVDAKLFPVALMDVWPKAVIVDAQGDERPLCTGPVVTLLSPKTADKPSWLTPKLLFAVLLIITVIISLTEYFRGRSVVGKILDALLLTVETFFGLVILYLLLFSNQVATSWNWLLFVFSPLPLVLWLSFRRHQEYYYVYPCYIIILLSFCIFSPFIPQMQYGALTLLLLSMAVRCLFLWHHHLVIINNKFIIKQKNKQKS